MAYLTPIPCQDCGQDFFGDSYRGMASCPSCAKKAEDADLAAHFAELDKMTIEERIRRLEEISYNRSKAAPVYVPPPVY